MKDKTYIFSLFLLAFFLQNVYAQIAKEDFKKVNDAYRNTMNLSMDVTYKLYESYKSTTPKDILTGSFKKQDNNILSNLLKIETMQNTKYKIIVDAANKILVVADPQHYMNNAITVDIDSVLAFCSSVDYRETGQKLKVYKLNFDNIFFEYNSIEIFINKYTYFLDKLTLYFRDAVSIDKNDPDSPKEKPRLEIAYSSVNKDPKFGKNLFSEKKYIDINDGKFTCSALYKNYQLINQKLIK